MEPTFVIAGGQRCGTTSLCRLIAPHPEIHLAHPLRPEPKFFLAEPTAERDRAWYLDRWFADTGAALAAGEKSTSYLECPQAARRMKRLFPQLKLVFLLRHPVERAISNYRFSRDEGYETDPFGWSVRHESDRARERVANLSVDPFAYLRRGRYAELLAPFFAEFDRPAVRIYLTEELGTDPLTLLADLFDFLGVDPAYRPAEPDRKENVHRPDELVIDPVTLEFLFDHYRAPNAQLARLLGRDLDHWNRPTEAIMRYPS